MNVWLIDPPFSMDDPKPILKFLRDLRQFPGWRNEWQVVQSIKDAQENLAMLRYPDRPVPPIRLPRI